MPHIRYGIVPHMGGWSVACGGVSGPPYLQREVALQDAAWVATLLGKAGEEVRVYLDGEPVDLDPMRATEETRQ
jgi:hypothetical protein